MEPHTTSVLTAIKIGKTLIAAGRAIERPGRERLELVEERANRQVGQVSHAVAKALVAHALGRSPSDEDVDAFMAAAVDDPAFPARAYRLLGEARKTASIRRQKLLASVLLGAERFSEAWDEDDRGEQERDRIDTLVERLTLADVDLLVAIVALARQSFPPNTDDIKYELSLYAIEHLRGDVEIAAEHQIQAGTLDLKEGDRDTIWPTQTALLSLTLNGCVERPDRSVKKLARTRNGDEFRYTTLFITDLGEMLVDALAEVKAGMDAEVANLDR